MTCQIFKFRARLSRYDVHIFAMRLKNLHLAGNSKIQIPLIKIQCQYSSTSHNFCASLKTTFTLDLTLRNLVEHPHFYLGVPRPSKNTSKNFFPVEQN